MIVKYNDEEIVLCDELEDGEIDKDEVSDDTVDLSNIVGEINE